MLVPTTIACSVSCLRIDQESSRPVDRHRIRGAVRNDPEGRLVGQVPGENCSLLPVAASQLGDIDQFRSAACPDQNADACPAGRARPNMLPQLHHQSKDTDEGKSDNDVPVRSGNRGHEKPLDCSPAVARSRPIQNRGGWY